MTTAEASSSPRVVLTRRPALERTTSTSSVLNWNYDLLLGEIDQAVADVTGTIRNRKPLAGVGLELERDAHVALEERALLPQWPRAEQSTYERRR